MSRLEWNKMLSSKLSNFYLILFQNESINIQIKFSLSREKSESSLPRSVSLDQFWNYISISHSTLCWCTSSFNRILFIHEGNPSCFPSRLQSILFYSILSFLFIFSQSSSYSSVRDRITNYYLITPSFLYICFTPRGIYLFKISAKIIK